MIEVWVWCRDYIGDGSFRAQAEHSVPNMELRAVHPEHPNRPPDPIVGSTSPGLRGQWVKVRMTPVNVFDALNCIDTTDWSDVS